LIHGRLNKGHDGIPAYCAQPEIGVAMQEFNLRELSTNLLQLVKDTPRVDVVDGNHSLLI
jgi:hypothetical protein